MKGLLTLEPDAPTTVRLRTIQNRLRDVMTRQGVSFPDRLGIPLLSWPFATEPQLFEAGERLQAVVIPSVRFEPLSARPHADRPAEIGFAIQGLEELQRNLFCELKEALDPDPPKAGFIRLARISPASRKVGAAFHGSGLLGAIEEGFIPVALILWKQTPLGFEVCRTMPVDHGRS